MEFKYSMKGKGRKNVIEVPFKPSTTDKEKTEERKGDIPEEPLGWHGTLKHPPLFGPNEEEKTENVDEEEREKEDEEEREMERKKKKKKKKFKKKKKEKIRKKKKNKKKNKRNNFKMEEEKEEEDKGTAASEGQDKLREVNEIL